MTHPKKRKRRTAKEWGELANHKLQANCTHGLKYRDYAGDLLPSSKWDCWGCTGAIVSAIVRSVRRGR